MTCPVHRRKQSNKPVPAMAKATSLPIWEQRASICDAQSDCRCGNTCLPTEEKYPGRSSIRHGVRDIANACPKGLWPRILERCPACTRAALVPEGDVCIYCANKMRLRAGRKKPAPVGIRHDLSRIHAGQPLPSAALDPDWFVAVTTAPRKQCTLTASIATMRRAGWEPVVFAEPGATRSNAHTIVNPSRLGVWRNWLASAEYALANTSAKRILTVQDDSLFHPDSKAFVDAIDWPARNAAFVSLYTPKHYSKGRSVGINRVKTRSLWGACALVWDRQALAKVVRHETARTWLGASPKSGQGVYQKRRDNPDTIANSDTAIGKVINSIGMSMWFIDPSPVYHAAEYSTINHGGNDGRRNCGRCADHDKPLAEQVWPKG